MIRGNLKLFGGTVTGNTASRYGGGILGCPDGLIELQGNPKVYENHSGDTKDQFDNLYLDGNEDSGTDVTLPVAITGPLTDGVRIGLSRWVCPDSGEHPYRDMIISSKDMQQSSGTYTMTEKDSDRLAQTLEEENKQLYADNMQKYAFIPYGGKIVMILPVDIELDKEILTFGEIGETEKIMADITPVNALIQDVRWSSSDESVAVVDEQGLVTAKGYGEAVITATTVSPYHARAACKVKVAAYYRVTTKAEHGEITYEPEAAFREGTLVSAQNDGTGIPADMPEGTFQEGASVCLTVKAEEGYHLKEGSLKAYKTGDESTEVEIRENTLVMPDYDVTVTAEFEKEETPVTPETPVESGDEPENKEPPVESGDEPGGKEEPVESSEEPGSKEPPETGSNESEDVTPEVEEPTANIPVGASERNIYNNPQTDDDMAVWYMLAVLSAIGILLLGVLRCACMKNHAIHSFKVLDDGQE